VDEDKKECALVTDRTALDAASRRALEDVLARRHLWSVIEAVVAADIDHGLRRLTVRTDRGLRSILIGDPDKHLRECDRGARLIIDDLAGNRFIVPRLGDLDPRSRALLKDVL
jgi:hypothetical protein